MRRFSRHVPELLAAYIDGELGPEETRQVALHLDGCDSCRREHALVQSGMTALEQIPLAHAPDAIWSAIEAGGCSREVPRNERARPWRVVFAVSALALFVCVAFWAVQRTFPQPDRPWELARLHGTPVVDAKPVRGAVRIGAGESIETNSSATATVKLGQLGFVEIAPNTRVTVVATRSGEDRIALTRGGIHARISAPPRLFFVDTAAGTAVDLGCEYSLHTDERGSGRLDVMQGWVAFRWKGQESLVPAGASCVTRPKAGPGVPYFDDASANFKQAVDNFAAANFEGSSLDAVLADARVRDTLTLWHLLPRVNIHDRERIYNRMAALAPVPAGISRDKVLKLDPHTLTRWKDELAWLW